jgi:phosphoribosyl 1,2-cyclic phosphodiesterase
VEDIKIGVTVLGSGSKGNATLIHFGERILLIDNGFSCKEFCKRCAEKGIDPQNIVAILVSHEHSDHSKGVRVLSKKFNIPVYSTPGTMRHLTNKNLTAENNFIFEPGSSFEVEKFHVEVFSIPHDAMQPVGFVIRVNDKKIGLATDFGHFTRLILQRLYACDLLAIETNYDLDLLKQSNRGLGLIRRIMGPNGHLDNKITMDNLDLLLTEKTKYLILAHLSTDCNDYNLVKKLIAETLEKINRSSIVTLIAKQDSSLPTVWL